MREISNKINESQSVTANYLPGMASHVSRSRSLNTAKVLCTPTHLNEAHRD